MKPTRIPPKIGIARWSAVPFPDSPAGTGPLKQELRWKADRDLNASQGCQDRGNGHGQGHSPDHQLRPVVCQDSRHCGWNDDEEAGSVGHDGMIFGGNGDATPLGMGEEKIEEGDHDDPPTNPHQS